MSKSTRKQTWRKASKDERPKKPSPGFPLYAYPLGYWSKKIAGKIHHFGRWGRVVNGQLTRIDGDSWEDALKLYNLRKEDLQAGRTPRILGDERLTIADLCNRFLTSKLRKMEASEMSKRMFAEYREITDLIISAFGKERMADDLAPD